METDFSEVSTLFGDRRHLVEEPRIDLGGRVNLFDRFTSTQYGFELEDSFWSSDARLSEEFVDGHVVVGRFAWIAVESKSSLLEGSESLL